MQPRTEASGELLLASHVQRGIIRLLRYVKHVRHCVRVRGLVIAMTHREIYV